MSVKRIKVVKLKVIKNKKGNLSKYLSKRDKYFSLFGETYFTEIKKNMVKGWNYHEKCTCLISVIYGKVKFTFADQIDKKKRNITIGKKNFSLIVLPPKVWFKFTSLEGTSIIVNTINKVHSLNEVKKSLIK
jgi:dTDP-4-dehydrorhamnose 3,5-epimerase